MTYELTLPPEIEQRLATRASASGQDVVQLIQIAVVRFVGESGAFVEGEWTSAMQQRRSELVDKEIAEVITPTECVELAELDQKGNDYYDAVAAPPLDGARALHQKLLQSRGQQ